AKLGRLLEAHRRARLGHSLLHFLKQFRLLPFEHQAQAADLLAIVLTVDAEIARSGALADAVQDARPKPAPARIVFFDVKLAGAELEDPLQNLQRRPQTLGAGERTIELHATPPGATCDLHSWKIFARANLQIRKRLVVLEIDIEARLNVLDQPGLH